MKGGLTSIIIPCWNGLRHTRVCLRHVLRWTTLPFELILIDNGSRDGTGAWLRSLRAHAVCGKSGGSLRRMKIIHNRENSGYPVAMNQGIRSAHGDWWVFGNNDAAVTPFWLEGMRSAFSCRLKIGGVAPFSNPMRRPNGGGSGKAAPGFPTDMRGLERLGAACFLRGEDPAYIPSGNFVPGFWFLTKASVMRRVGLFDPAFSPMGYEDWDLQWRMRQAGYRLGFAGRSYVHHLWSGIVIENKMDPAEFFTPQKLGILLRKYPEVYGISFEVRSPGVSR